MQLLDLVIADLGNRQITWDCWCFQVHLVFGNRYKVLFWGRKIDFPVDWRAPSLEMEPQSMLKLYSFLMMYKSCLLVKICLNLIDSRDIVLYNSPLQTIEKPCLWLEVSYASAGPEESSVSGFKASLCSSEMNILNLLLNIRSWMFVYFRVSCSPVHSAQQETKYGRETRRNRSVQLLSRLSQPSSLSRLTVFITLDKLNSLKQKDKLPISKPKVPLVTTKPTKQDRKQTTTFSPTTAGTGTCLESYLT